MSLERSKELRNQIGLESVREKPDFFSESEEETPVRDKIIKTKGYY